MGHLFPSTIHSAGSLVSPVRELSLGRGEGQCWDRSLAGFLDGQILRHITENVPTKGALREMKRCVLCCVFVGGDVLLNESGQRQSEID